MPVTESYVHDQLTLEKNEADEDVTIRFLGKSILRDPAEFILPILLAALTDASSTRRRLVLDFCELTYMNSSTLTPLIKVLERARLGDDRLTARYRKALKWQAVSFSALTIFQTPDGRVAIEGKEES